MKCITYTDGSCGAGLNWWVRNTSTTTSYEPTIDVLQDGTVWGARAPGVLRPGERAPLNVCSYDSGHSYSCVVVGEIQH